MKQSSSYEASKSSANQ